MRPGDNKNEALSAVPAEMLEEYVLEQIRLFAVEFAQQLVPQITQQHLDLAFSRALYALSARTSQQALKLQLRFTHKCKYLGCANTDCPLCKHNPHKTCPADDNFDEAYADNQVLRTRCDADVHVELFNAATGEPFSAPGVEVQLVAIDGEAYNPTASSPLYTIKTLMVSDNKTPILQSTAGNPQVLGTVVVPLQGGRARLPDVFIADKNDTAKFQGEQAGKFALMALAVRRGEGGQLVAIEHVTPAVSNPFVVKTQRALNDYRKSAFPHYKDEITRLRYIGVVSANRLKDARAHLGPDVPLSCVDTVEDLKKLLEYADTNRKVENKLLEMLNMRGRTKYKWDSLKQVLAEKVVYDDNNVRLWMAPDGSGAGLLFYAKQAQVPLDKPAALVQHMMGVDGFPQLQVMNIKDSHDPVVMQLTRTAEEAWKQPGHSGWQILTQPIDRVNAWSGVPITTTPAAPPPGAQQQPMAAMAAAGHGDAPLGGSAYPTVLRDILGEVPSPSLGRNQVYPNIPPGGVAPQFNAAAAAAAAGDQQGGSSSTPLRHTSDVAMSEPPAGTTDAAARAAGAAAAAADDTHDSAFLQQHPFDNIERACAMDDLRHPSDTSDAATAASVVAAAQAAAAAAAVAAGAGAEGANANKRGRGAAEELAPVGAAGPRTLYHSESAGRHLPVPRSSPDAVDTPDAAAPPVPSFGLDLPLLSDMPSFGGMGLGSLATKDVTHLLEQLSSELRAGQAAAAAGDRQQQHDQDRARGADRGADGLALTNSMSGLNLVPTSVSGPRAGLGPSGSSSLLLPMSGDLNSLRLLSSLAFLHSSLKPEDSFKQVLNQVNLGSPRASSGLDAILQEPLRGSSGQAAAGSGGGRTAAADVAADAGGPFAAAAAAAAAGGAAPAGAEGSAARSRLHQETR